MQELPSLGVEARRRRSPWVSGLPDDGSSGRFLSWAIKTRLAGPDLKVQPHRRGTSPRMNAKDQDEAVQRVVHSDEFTPRDRAAAILVLVFGQQIEDVVGLTWDDINVTDELVTIQIGSVEIALPVPLDGPWRCLAANPGNDLTAAHPNSNWVFPATPPVATSTPATSAITVRRASNRPTAPSTGETTTQRPERSRL